MAIERTAQAYHDLPEDRKMLRQSSNGTADRKSFIAIDHKVRASLSKGQVTSKGYSDVGVGSAHAHGVGSTDSFNKQNNKRPSGSHPNKGKGTSHVGDPVQAFHGDSDNLAGIQEGLSSSAKDEGQTVSAEFNYGLPLVHEEVDEENYG